MNPSFLIHHSAWALRKARLCLSILQKAPKSIKSIKSISRTNMQLTNWPISRNIILPVSIWKRGIACQVKSHLRCDENGRQLNKYLDSDVHGYIYVDVVIIQHKACTRRRLKGNQMTTRALRDKTCGPANWRKRTDGRNHCFSSSASYSL